MASATKSAWKNPSYLQSSFGIFMFFCSWGIWWSFFQRWLISGVGLTNAEVGTIYSINSLATLVIMFVYGVIQDQLGIKRKLVIVVSVIAACVGPFVQFVYAPMILAGGTTRLDRRTHRLHRSVCRLHVRLLPVRGRHRTLLP